MHPCPLRRRRGHGVRQYRRRPTRPGGAGQASCSLWAHAPPGQDTYRRFPPTGEGRRSPPGDGWDHLRLPRPDPCLGTVAERQEHGPAGNGQKPLCPRGGRGERLVSGTPPLVPPRPASSPILHDAGPLRLLRRWRQHSAVTLVRQSGRADLAKVVVSARSTGLAPMGQLQRTPETPPAASRPDHPRLRRRERTSLVKNRMREIRTSGSVRDGGGDVPIYSADRMVAADQFAAAFDKPARHEIVEGDDPAADAVARLDDGDIVADAAKLVGGGEPGEAGTNYDDGFSGGFCRFGQNAPTAEQHCRAGGERLPQKFAARR